MKELKDLIRNRVIDFNDSYPKEMKELHTKAIIAALVGEAGNRYCNDNVTLAAAVALVGYPWFVYNTKLMQKKHLKKYLLRILDWIMN